MSHRYIASIAALSLIGFASFKLITACPFCPSVSTTLSEEMGDADVAVIAKLTELPPETEVEDLTNSFDAVRATPRAKFEVLEFLKGQEHVGEQKQIEAIYFGSGPIGQTYLMLALDAPNLNWSTPIEVSERARKYLSKLLDLPAKGLERSRFFLDYLEDSDEMLTRDTYDEFARMSYDEVKAIKEYMDHDRLVEWIQDFDIPPSRRRLYLTMLGVCGTVEDTSLLEGMIRSENRKAKSGLDAMIACYLTLIGEQGVPLIEDLFLKNKDAEYTDTYAAIMALRFHGTQDDVIDKQRVVLALQHMLDRPQLADLVVPDLARWKDWESLPRLVNLFKRSTDENNWVRVPVINYLRACPLPEAELAIAELEKIDPDAVRRARTFYPEGSDTKSDEKVVSAEATDDGTADTEVTELDSNKTDSVAEVKSSDSQSAVNSRATEIDKPATASMDVRLDWAGIGLIVSGAILALSIVCLTAMVVVRQLNRKTGT